jgi:hypothetical protein
VPIKALGVVLKLKVFMCSYKTKEDVHVQKLSFAACVRGLKRVGSRIARGGLGQASCR